MSECGVLGDADADARLDGCTDTSFVESLGDSDIEAADVERSLDACLTIRLSDA